VPYKDKEKQRAAQAAWYQKNKEGLLPKQRERRRKDRAERFAYVAAIKESTPCVDCGLEWPSYVMDFDHRGSDKIAAVSVLCHKAVPYARIDAEIAKCELVCSNCHRIRTWGH
jgi:hypothetical protein